jgi:hypothetical protein
MKLRQCEFEEAEYRGPLFNQLQTSHLLWEPGQVFEEHIGIDHAMWTAHVYLHSLFGYSAPLDGVRLSRHRWDYIWATRKRRKKLPGFALNVFIQAKRPMYGRYAPKDLRDKGLKSPFWRFEITEHQQLALEKLQANLGTRAIVSYACPAFHKESLLHKWTVARQIVEQSTFPPIGALTGHGAWNFSEPGASGVANADPVRIEETPLAERLDSLVRGSTEATKSDTRAELVSLAGAARAAMEPIGDQVTSLQAQFAEHLRLIEQLAFDVFPDRNHKTFVAYGTVLLFAQMNRLNWFVAGGSEL